MRVGEFTMDLDGPFFEQLADAVERRIRGRLIANQDRYLSTAKAAAYLDCSEQRIRKLVMTGDLPRFKDGSRNLFRLEDLEEFVQQGGGTTP